MKKGFDNAKYLQMQSQHIRERIAQFDNKLYLEFGGKLFDDYHASRVLPGFEPGLPIFIPGSQPRKAQFFPESALCGGHDRGTEGHYCQRGYGKNLGKRKGALPDDRIKR